MSGLYHADCLTLLPSIADASVDLILADLPYGTTQNRWDSVIPLDPLWHEYRRILKPNGTVVLTSQGAFTARLIMSNLSWFKYKIVWTKSKATNFLNARRQPLRKHEDICVFAPKSGIYNPVMTEGEPYDKGIRKDALTGSYGAFKPARVKSDGSRYPTDVIYFKTAESETERKVWHGTQKPVALMSYLVRTYSQPGDTVLDNAMGSGTTGVACRNEGRRFIGIENDPAFFQIASERLAA